MELEPILLLGIHGERILTGLMTPALDDES